MSLSLLKASRSFSEQPDVKSIPYAFIYNSKVTCSCLPWPPWLAVSSLPFTAPPAPSSFFLSLRHTK